MLPRTVLVQDQAHSDRCERAFGRYFNGVDSAACRGLPANSPAHFIDKAVIIDRMAFICGPDWVA